MPWTLMRAWPEALCGPLGYEGKRGVRGMAVADLLSARGYLPPTGRPSVRRLGKA